MAVAVPLDFCGKLCGGMLYLEQQIRICGECKVNWINIYGLAFMLFIMIPNIIFAVKNKSEFQNLWNNKIIEVFEQIGRFGCFGFMTLIIPGCGFGFSSDESFALNLTLNTVLTVGLLLHLDYLL